MGRGEGSKRGIKGTLPCLPFKQQLAQHSSTARGSLWLHGFVSSASLGPGQGCGAPFFLFFIFFSSAGDSIGGILLAETRRAVLQVSQL